MTTTNDNARRDGVCSIACSAFKDEDLDWLDWSWINKAGAAINCGGNRREYALEVLNMAAAHPPYHHCERGMFRAIKHANDRIEILCVVADADFIPNDADQATASGRRG